MLSFGVFYSILITKAIQDWGEFYRIHGKVIGSSFTWRIQALKLYSPLPKANQESKERNLTWRIQEDSNCWPHLEYFLESISYILYVFSKPRKSGIQRFKQYTNWSWNEGVIAIGSQSHQVGCEISLWLRNHPLATKWRPSTCEISQPILHACEIHLSASRYLGPTLLDFFLQIFVV